MTGYDAATPVLGGAVVADLSADPDPPNSRSGAADDYLWVSGFGADDDETASYTSLNFTGLAQVQSNSSSADSCHLCVQYREQNASTQNPAGAEEEYVAFTFTVKPDSAGISLPSGLVAPTPILCRFPPARAVVRDRLRQLTGGDVRTLGDIK